MDTEKILGLSVLAAAVGAVSTLLSVAIKDYWFSRSFEKWKQRNALIQIYERIRIPLSLAACELASRLAEIVQHYPTVYLSSAVLDSKPGKQIHNSTDDPYFRRHKLVSTCYRLSAVLGWIELFRQEATFLNPSSSTKTRLLAKALEELRIDLADGQIIEAEDWEQWRDTLVFREELRAIGESMLCAQGQGRVVMGYCRFIDLLESGQANPVARWSPVVFNFLLDQQSDGKDFRRVRMERLIAHLIDLVDLIEPGRIGQSLRGNHQYRTKLMQKRGG